MASGSSIFLLVSERNTEVAEELPWHHYSVKGGHLGQEELLRGPAISPRLEPRHTSFLLPPQEGGVMRCPVLEGHTGCSIVGRWHQRSAKSETLSFDETLSISDAKLSTFSMGNCIKIKKAI